MRRTSAERVQLAQQRRAANARAQARRISVDRERRAEAARAQTDRDRIERAHRERQLAFGVRRKLIGLGRLYQRCVERWPRLRIYTPLSGTGRRVCVQRATDTPIVRAVRSPIADLVPAQMGLAAIAEALNWMEAMET